MAATQVQRSQGHYFKVLESHKKRLGNYEQMHFRKSFAIPKEKISLAPRRSSHPQLVPFDKSTAATYLRQTESQWLLPNLTRQEAAKLLFNKPTGTFLVRKSHKERHYALSLRMPVNDPAVSHFLIQTNQQNFLTIQGSNLPFLSLYDLLAYFCFHQSGGMPCCLRAPVNPIQAESSDSSDSEPDDSATRDPEHLKAPKDYSVNSRWSSPIFISNHGDKTRPPTSHEEIFIDQSKQDSYVKSVQSKQFEKVKDNENTLSTSYSRERESRSQGSSPLGRPRRIPPPKPPRTDLLPGGEPLDTSEREQVEIYKSARRVSGIVDMHISRLYSQATGITKKSSTATQSKTENNETRTQKNSPPTLMEPRAYKPRNRVIPIPSLVKPSDQTVPIVNNRRPRLPKSQSLDMVTNNKPGSPKISSLIKMFESKSPNNSPPAQHHSLAKMSSPFLPRECDTRQKRDSERNSVPFRPPKPQPPPVPPKPLMGPGNQSLIIPPRTPAPLLPPKPPGSKPPVIFPRLSHRSSLSDFQPVAVMNEGVTKESPPITPPKNRRLSNGAPIFAHATEEEFPYQPVTYQGSDNLTEDINSHVLSKSNLNKDPSKYDVSRDDWAVVPVGGEPVTNIPSNQQEQSADVTGTTSSKSSKWRPKPWSKILKFQRRPRKRIRKFILELAADSSQEFGKRIGEFITEMRAKSTEPHQKMLNEIRNFLTEMHEHLLKQHKQSLINCGMESCDNFGHVVETTLQQVILHPLSHYIYLRIEEYYSQNMFLFQVQRSIHQGKLKQPEEMGIRANLVVPGEKAIADITEVFSRMMKTPCAISKLEYLLEAVRLTYDNVRDSKQPKKAMNDLGADDFLPLFVWVLVQCGFYRAEIEAEYMWGLAHPSLFNGEGGYYLTTLTSAVNVLKELTQPPSQTTIQTQQLPAMNEMQTELKVYCEDEHTGQYSTAFYLPIVPTMTAAEICEIIAEKRRILTPEKYALFKVVNGQSTLIENYEQPQEIKLQWTLDRSSAQAVDTSTALIPSSRFIAYKLRTVPSSS